MPAIHSVLGLIAFAMLIGQASTASAQSPRVIELTQTPCQFLEPEKGIDRGFVSRSKTDCEDVNRRTADERLKEAQELRLAPGRYVFRVRNAGVPYELGFWLRGQGVRRLTLPSVSGGGLWAGESKDYAIALVEGDYVFSCPLNPTPDYRLTVRSPS